jgi:hypothetical protein
MATLYQSTPFRTSVLGIHHPITGALYAPGYFHQFILATIPERSILPMQPLDWHYGTRADRPFNVVPGLHGRSPPPKWPTRPCDRPQYPTAYYLDQLRFWDDGPLLPEEAITAEPAPEKTWFDFALMILLWILALAAGMARVVLAAIGVVASAGGKVCARMVRERTWEFALSALVATQIVRMLPEIGGWQSRGGGGAGAISSDAPLYVMRIPNPNQWSRLSRGGGSSRLLIICR